MLSNRSIEEKPLSRSELLAAMIVFLLPLLFGILGTSAIRLPQWLTRLELILFLGPMLFALGLAVVKGLPRWSLSYLGFVLTLGIIFGRYDRLWTWLYPYFVESFGPRSLWPVMVRILYGGGFAFIVGVSVLVGAVILLNLLRLLPHTPAVWQRIRVDWTQLSFVPYGGLVVYVHAAFEGFQHEDMWKFTAWICLALGAWFYLRAKGQRQRILALIGGATGAMWIVAIAQWVLIPLQNWQSRYYLISMEDLRWVELGNTIIGWIGILVAMMAPALLNILPSSPTPDLDIGEHRQWMGINN